MTTFDDAHYKSPGEIAKEMEMELPEYINSLADESSVRACCSEDCLVEPDGKCPHGFKSVLVELGLI